VPNSHVLYLVARRVLLEPRTFVLTFTLIKIYDPSSVLNATKLSGAPKSSVVIPKSGIMDPRRSTSVECLENLDQEAADKALRELRHYGDIKEMQSLEHFVRNSLSRASPTTCGRLQARE
jgi:hypothetical protein